MVRERPSLARNRYWTANLYVASSSYAVECPTPFNDPAVASERCAISPESDIPQVRMRRSRTRRLDRKLDELHRFRVFVLFYLWLLLKDNSLTCVPIDIKHTKSNRMRYSDE